MDARTEEDRMQQTAAKKRITKRISFRIAAILMAVLLVLTTVLLYLSRVAIQKENYERSDAAAAVSYLMDSTEYVEADVASRVGQVLYNLVSAPKTLPDHYALASTYIAREEYEKALLHIEKCMQMYAGESDVLLADLWLKKGCLHVLLDQSDLALTCLSQASVLQPGDPQAYLITAQVYAQRQDVDSMVDSLANYVALVPNDMDMCEALGEGYVVQGKYDLAKPLYDRCIEKDENNANAYYMRGVCNLSLQLFIEAESDFTTAIQMDTSAAQSHYHRGVCFMALGRFNDAVSDFTVSMEADNQMQACLYNRGICYWQLDDIESAKTDMTAAAGMEGDWQQSAEDILTLLE